MTSDKTLKFSVQKFNAAYAMLWSDTDKSSFLAGMFARVNTADHEAEVPSSSRPFIDGWDFAQGLMTPKKTSPKQDTCFGLPQLSYPVEVLEQFDRAWEAWPKTGWNFSTKSAAPRRINRTKTLERFYEIVRRNTITKEDGSNLNAIDLADITIHFVKGKTRGQSPDYPPCICCIDNFYSSEPNKQNPWKDACADFFGVK